MSDDGPEDGHGRGFQPVLAIPFGSMAGTLVGIVLGSALGGNIGYTLVAGAAIGSLLGTVVFALLQGSKGA